MYCSSSQVKVSDLLCYSQTHFWVAEQIRNPFVSSGEGKKPLTWEDRFVSSGADLKPLTWEDGYCCANHYMSHCNYLTSCRVSTTLIPSFSQATRMGDICPPTKVNTYFIPWAYKTSPLSLLLNYTGMCTGKYIYMRPGIKISWMTIFKHTFKTSATMSPPFLFVLLSTCNFQNYLNFHWNTVYNI